MRKKILILSLVIISVCISQQIPKHEIITERHSNSLKKTVMVFQGTGIQEILVGKYGFYESGLKSYVELYQQNKKHGKSIQWYENGQKKLEGNFKEGKEDGLSIVPSKDLFNTN